MFGRMLHKGSQVSGILERPDARVAPWAAAQDDFDMSRIDAPLVTHIPCRTRRRQAFSLLHDLLAADDWPGIAAVLDEWAASRSRSEDGRLFLDGAIEALIEGLADGVRPSHPDGPRTLPVFAIETLGRVVDMGAMHGHHPALAALAARCLILHAWSIRAPMFAETLCSEANAATDHLVAQAEALLAQHRDATPLSPYIAAAEIAALPFTGNEATDVTQAWHRLALAEPSYLTPMADIARYLLPDAFGTAATFGETLRDLSFATTQTVGMAAYAVGALAAIEVNPNAFLWLDEDLFDQGCRDLAAQRRADPVEITCLYLALHKHAAGPGPITLRGQDREVWRLHAFRAAKTAKAILAEHLTAIVPEAWGDTETAYAHLQNHFRKDLRAGSSLRVGRNGVAVYCR